MFLGAFDFLEGFKSSREVYKSRSNQGTETTQ